MMENESKVSEITTRQDPLIHALVGQVADTMHKGHAFALWQLPGEQQKHMLTCASAEPLARHTTFPDKEGFVMVPFSDQATSWFFPQTQYQTITPGSVNNGTATMPALHYANKSDQTLPDFEDLVSSAVSEIEANHFEKVVLACYCDMDIPAHFNPVEAFCLLGDQYPQAFVSLVSSPQTGTWLTASPELLVETTADGTFRTVALAGTQPLAGKSEKEIGWTQKEIEEQAMVTRYIIDCFKQVRMREYVENGPRTVTTGNMAHLKSDFTVDMQAIDYPHFGRTMLGLLHPTSAVCGMPKAGAQSFIETHEQFDRSFYTGYLGPVHQQGANRLFVNLRCAQLFSHTLRIYAGAGITADSDPAKEKAEVTLKMNALQGVL